MWEGFVGRREYGVIERRLIIMQRAGKESEKEGGVVSWSQIVFVYFFQLCEGICIILRVVLEQGRWYEICIFRKSVLQRM